MCVLEAIYELETTHKLAPRNLTPCTSSRAASTCAAAVPCFSLHVMCSVMLDDTLCGFFPWSGRSRGTVSCTSRTPSEVRCGLRLTRTSPSGSSLDRRSWSYSRSRSGHESSSCSTPGRGAAEVAPVQAGAEAHHGVGRLSDYVPRTAQDASGCRPGEMKRPKAAGLGR